MKKINLAGFALLVLTLPISFGTPSLFAAEDAAKQQEMLKAKKAELNNHEWEVNLTKAGTKEPVKDTLIFKEMMFESKMTAAQGYKPTNYTITLQEGGPSIFETMQSNDKGQPVFWRGEWEGESMRGMMSKQLGEGKNEDYYFSSLSIKAIEPPKPVEPPKAEVPAEVPAVVDEAAKAVEAVDAKVNESAEDASQDVVPVVEEAKKEIKEIAAEAPAVPEVKAEEAKSKKKWRF